MRLRPGLLGCEDKGLGFKTKHLWRHHHTHSPRKTNTVTTCSLDVVAMLHCVPTRLPTPIKWLRMIYQGLVEILVSEGVDHEFYEGP